MKSILFSILTLLLMAVTQSAWTTGNYAGITCEGDTTITIGSVVTGNITESHYTYSPAAVTYTATWDADDAEKGNWTISPAAVAEGGTLTATYSGTKHVKNVKYVKKAVGPTSTVTWTPSVLGVQYISNREDEIEGIKLECTSNSYFYCQNSSDPYEFHCAGGSFTFTAPDGKKFTQIVITPTDAASWANLAEEEDILGDGWPSGDDGKTAIESTGKVTWTGNEESVELLSNYIGSGGSAITLKVTEIVFTIE